MKIDQITASLESEIRICKHLHTKLDPENLDYRPGENMRTLLELLEYLCWCGVSPTEFIVTGENKAYGKHRDRVKGMTFDQFPGLMDEQARMMRNLLSDVSEADLAEKTAMLPWGEEVSWGRALLELSLKFLTAYRMQLFLYAKSAGASDLNTANCWIGKDWKKPDA